MNATMTIQDFNALMQGKQEESALLKVLRRLTTVEKPDQVRLLKGATIQACWTGWSY